MADRLKDRFFADKFFTELANAIQGVYPKFDRKEFHRLVNGDDWESKELKEKMRHTTHCLRATLPENYPEALKILSEVAPRFGGSFDAMVFPDFVECYGLDEWDVSIPALALFTKLASSEFAIRPFLEKDPERGMYQMRQWAMDENPHLRRLASEGCRPRLPWAMALSAFKQDPRLIFPVLETLKDDPSEYVRKSVANNLNDISKDHPDQVLDISEQWLGQNKNRDWIVKRACRTLLKAGNTRALLLFGFGDPGQIRINNLVFDKQKLAIGDEMRFTFEMNLNTKNSFQVRLEYMVSFVKAGGKLSGKIFQIREGNYEPGRHIISRKHSFKDLSTRKHYPGPHTITIIVNGVEKVTEKLELVPLKKMNANP